MRGRKYERVVEGGSSKTLKQVRMYPVSINDPRTEGLITWYIKKLQRAIDVIWENVEWRYKFPKIKGK
jgi:putative transposase